MTSKAEQTYEEFHARKSEDEDLVYPYNDSGASSTFDMPVRIPHLVRVGKAIRVYYDSDKWKDIGDVQGYYHDHGPEDGEHPFRPSNKIKLYAPECYFSEDDIVTSCKLPVVWPSELVPLGACAGWVAEVGRGKEKNLLEGECDNAVLVSSPFGHVSKRDPKRVFLAVIDLHDDTVEAIIDGAGLRLNDRGIEG